MSACTSTSFYLFIYQALLSLETMNVDFRKFDCCNRQQTMTTPSCVKFAPATSEQIINAYINVTKRLHDSYN